MCSPRTSSSTPTRWHNVGGWQTLEGIPSGIAGGAGSRSCWHATPRAWVACVHPRLPETRTVRRPDSSLNRPKSRVVRACGTGDPATPSLLRTLAGRLVRTGGERSRAVRCHTGFPVDRPQSIACRRHARRPTRRNLKEPPFLTFRHETVPDCPSAIMQTPRGYQPHQRPPPARPNHETTAEGGTPGWHAIRASRPSKQSRHHRDGISPVTAFLVALQRPTSSWPRCINRGTTRGHANRCWTALPSIGRTLRLAPFSWLVLAALSGSRDFESPG